MSSPKISVYRFYSRQKRDDTQLPFVIVHKCIDNCGWKCHTASRLWCICMCEACYSCWYAMYLSRSWNLKRRQIFYGCRKEGTLNNTFLQTFDSACIRRAGPRSVRLAVDIVRRPRWIFIARITAVVYVGVVCCCAGAFTAIGDRWGCSTICKTNMDLCLMPATN